MMDARASVINNNVNQLMKNLTIVTISISLPTFFASLFGMNVQLPFAMNGDASTGSPVAFWGIIAVCILSVVLFLAFWMRKK
jgi:magnesium transporter